jgi:hypothetical protein
MYAKKTDRSISGSVGKMSQDLPICCRGSLLALVMEISPANPLFSLVFRNVVGVCGMILVNYLNLFT